MNPHLGSHYDDFLEEEALLEATSAVAIKRVVAWQIAQEMKAQKLSKTALAEKMHTSRAALNRLLDETEIPELSRGTARRAPTIRGHLLVVVYTERGDNIRIMSCRKATSAERKEYERAT